MSNLPKLIIGGDPFNRFSYLYDKEAFQKLQNKKYALEVLRSAYTHGARAFDLSFESNLNLFRKLQHYVGNKTLIGIGNPTYKQGVFLKDKPLCCYRDRIIATLISCYFPKKILNSLENNSYLQKFIFNYKKSAKLLTINEIQSIYINYPFLRRRFSLFKDKCEFLMFGGDDADWLISLGRIDLVGELYNETIQQKFKPIFLCQYATYSKRKTNLPILLN